MTPRPDPLAVALDAVLGRTDAAVAPAWRERAARLRATALRVASAEPCPAPVLRRAEALFASRRLGAVARVLDLLFDSWAHARPAVRGAGRPRMLRFGGAPGTVDVEVEPLAGGGYALRLALHPAAGRTVFLAVRARGRPRRVPLDASGAGRATAPRGARGAVLVVREGRGEVFRTPRIPLG